MTEISASDDAAAVWQPRAGEEILREEKVETSDDRRRELMSARGLAVPVVGFAAMGLIWSIFFRADLPSSGVSLLPALVMVLAVLFAVAMGVAVSWSTRGGADLNRYVFTNQRLIALDARGRLVDEMGGRDFDVVYKSDGQLWLLRPDDEAADRAFVIASIADLDSVEGFVAATYEGAAL